MFPARCRDDSLSSQCFDGQLIDGCTDVVDENVYAFAVRLAVNEIEEFFFKGHVVQSTAIDRDDSQLLQERQSFWGGGHHRRLAPHLLGQGHFGQRHPTAPGTDKHILRVCMFHLGSPAAIGHLPVGIGGNVPQRKSCPLGQRKSRVFWNGNDLLHVQFYSPGQHAHRLRRIVAQNFYRIARLVPDAIAKDKAVIAGFEMVNGFAGFEDSDHACVADHHLFFLACHANIDWVSLDGMGHISFPTTIQGFCQNLFCRNIRKGHSVSDQLPCFTASTSAG